MYKKLLFFFLFCILLNQYWQKYKNKHWCCVLLLMLINTHRGWYYIIWIVYKCNGGVCLFYYNFVTKMFIIQHIYKYLNVWNQISCENSQILPRWFCIFWITWFIIENKTMCMIIYIQIWTEHNVYCIIISFTNNF